MLKFYKNYFLQRFFFWVKESIESSKIFFLCLGPMSLTYLKDDERGLNKFGVVKP
jgi:hypothetical protein